MTARIRAEGSPKRVAISVGPPALTCYCSRELLHCVLELIVHFSRQVDRRKFIAMLCNLKLSRPSARRSCAVYVLGRERSGGWQGPVPSAERCVGERNGDAERAARGGVRSNSETATGRRYPVYGDDLRLASAVMQCTWVRVPRSSTYRTRLGSRRGPASRRQIASRSGL